MGTMRFMSCSRDPKVATKVFSFDSSPGRAIGQAIGAGMWDEKSYTPELKETRDDERVYEVRMRRIGSDVLEKVGIITHHPSYEPPAAH